MTDEEWKAIELAEYERTYEKSLADGQWYGGPGEAQWLVRERDTLRARVAELERERDELLHERAVGTVDRMEYIEHDTAERIAAWLDGERDKYRAEWSTAVAAHRDASMQIAAHDAVSRIAADIRAHAWKAQP